MTRMIERWFPCAEVSESSGSGWGSGRTENALFVWFAARPIAQAKAAVIASLLPWPEEEAEQKRLQGIVRGAMTDRFGAWDELRVELEKAHPGGASVLDPFSGRGTIPLEAARLGEQGRGVDFSPLAALGSELLADYPFRDWSQEPELPFSRNVDLFGSNRLLADVQAVLSEVGRRHAVSMRDHYPLNSDGHFPWGYLWATTVPCTECGHRFPLFGSAELRRPSMRSGRGRGSVVTHDEGQSFYVTGNPDTGEIDVVVHPGLPLKPPTLVTAVKAEGKRGKGKAAVCPFCENAMPLSVHQRLTQEGHGRDFLLVVADLDENVGKRYRA